MKTCDKCGNRLDRPIYKRVSLGMGRYRRKKTGEYECSYCIWKGDAGPGAELKEIIKEMNTKRYCYWKPGGESGSITASSPVEAAKKIDPDAVFVWGHTSHGVTYMNVEKDQIMKIWEVKL